jgi:hypothetical protein
MELVKKYEYKPLPDPAKNIRVARVLPGAYDDDIRVEFCPRLLVVEEQDKASVSVIFTLLGPCLPGAEMCIIHFVENGVSNQ